MKPEKCVNCGYVLAVGAAGEMYAIDAEVFTSTYEPIKEAGGDCDCE